MMCQATVYLDGEELMRDVTYLRPTPDGLRVSTFFEAPKIVRAAIREIDLLKHRIWLETIPGSDTQPEES
jgi:predicted RNA-binding protein